MIGRLRNVLATIFGGRAPDLARVEPANPEHARVLHRADRLLASPGVKALLSERDRQLRASFVRAGRRLSR